jgi:hypothetical protein
MHPHRLFRDLGTVEGEQRLEVEVRDELGEKRSTRPSECPKPGRSTASTCPTELSRGQSCSQA